MGKELKRYEYRGRFYFFEPAKAPAEAVLVEKKAKKNNKGRKAADKAAEPADK